MCGREERTAWLNQEKQLNSSLREGRFWSLLSNTDADKQLMRLLESLVYTVGDDKVLETYVEQDATISNDPENLLNKRMQVVVFTQTRVCVGVLDNPSDDSNVCAHVVRRSGIRGLSISASRGAFHETDLSSGPQRLRITAEYDGLTDPLIIGSLESNRIGYDFADSLDRIQHLINLMTDDLDSSVSK